MADTHVIAKLRYMMCLFQQKKKHGKYFLAIDNDGQIISFFFLRDIKKQSAELGVGIRSDLCGKGYGKKIMGFLIEEGKKLGLKEVYLTCLPNNIAAIRLYTSFGFQNICKKLVLVGNFRIRYENLMFLSFPRIEKTN